MTNYADNTCQWFACSALATQHVKCGLRGFDVHAPQKIRELKFEYHHLDLCPHHVEYACLSFVFSTVFDLGECPDGCGKEAESRR